MEDTIEVCAGCGKMPRPIDREKGFFICTRCGSRATIQVSSDDYEKVVTELDQKFHERVMKTKVEEAAKEPITELASTRSRSRSPRKAAKKQAKKKAKKTVKKAKKKAVKKKAAKRTTRKKTTKKKPSKKTKKKRR